MWCFSWDLQRKMTAMYLESALYHRIGNMCKGGLRGGGIAPPPPPPPNHIKYDFCIGELKICNIVIKKMYFKMYGIWNIYIYYNNRIWNMSIKSPHPNADPPPDQHPNPHPHPQPHLCLHKYTLPINHANLNPICIIIPIWTPCLGCASISH